jgi:hypothetical protein
MSKDLPINSELVQAIRQRNPNMTDREIVALVDRLQREIGTHMSAGELLAFVKPNPDGTLDLTVYGIESTDDSERV